MSRVIEKNEYLNSEKYIILDQNNENVLIDLEIKNIYLYDVGIINFEDVVFKTIYTDLEHPLVVEKSNVFGDKNLYINSEYYLKNIYKINNVICNYIHDYKEEKFSLGSTGLINDEIIDAIVSNNNIKEVSLDEYSKDGYTLTVAHYKKFKEAGIRVGSKYVCEELKENFDDIIIANSEKSLISYFKYRDLVEKKGIYLDRELNEDELENLKYINPDLLITLNIDNFEYINVVNKKLKELGKNNIIKVKLDDKVKFNEFIFNNTLDGNIYVETPDLENVSLQDYLKFEKLLYEMIKHTNNLSPFEKYIYAYNITKQFKDYKENENNKNDSRKLYSLLVNEYMVCVGYSRLFGDLLSKMGIENKDLSVSVDISYDDVSNYEIEFKEVVMTEGAGHARRYIHIVDPKYGIDGYYVADPTWDNDLEHDYYNHLAMTDTETTFSKRYQLMNYMDIFNVNSIDDFIEKFNRIRNKHHYEEFLFEVIRVIDVLKVLDISVINKLKVKYDFVDKFRYDWPDNITDFIYDLGNEIINKVNKSISSDTLMEAVGNVYRNSYGYTEEELLSRLEIVRQENMERQSKMFPTRYKINKDGSSEIIMNEENKFDNVRKM